MGRALPQIMTERLDALEVYLNKLQNKEKTNVRKKKQLQKRA